MKLQTHTKRHEAVRVRRIGVASCGFVFVALFLLVSTGGNAQSGRKRPEPTPTPAGQRPRRAADTSAPVARPAPRPTPADQPGQPATPDEPRTTGAPQPTPTPLSGSDPDTGQSVVIDPDEVVHVNSNLVPIPASVIDAAGRAVIDLEVKDFELRVDGQPKPIGDLSRADTPVRLALLFDNSYSLRTARELEKQSAVRFFRTVIRPVDQAAIFSIWTEPVLEQPLTSDVNRLVSTIERYGDPDGSTSLFDTIVQAADYLRPQPGRKVIVIVSDGVETTSQLQDFNEVLRRVQSADVQVYVVQSEISPNANLHDLTAERRMQELAASTGGAVFAPQTTSDLPAAFAHISADLAQQYILSYYPDDERRDMRFRTINLRVTTRTGIRVRARRGYYPRRAQLSAATSYNAEQVASLTPDPMTLAPSAAQQPARIEQRTPTVRMAAPATGPSYGSKNLNPDNDDGVASRRAAPQPSATPFERAHNETPPPVVATATRPAETRIEVASTTTPPVPTVTPTPESTPTPTPAESIPTATPTPAPPTPSPTPAETKAPGARTTTPAQPQGPVSGGLLNSRAVKLPKPVFPETAKRMRVSGAVTVEVTIDESGKVISARAVNGPMLLRESATAAARQAVFTPTLLHDKPVRVSGVIVYNFSQ